MPILQGPPTVMTRSGLDKAIYASFGPRDHILYQAFWAMLSLRVKEQTAFKSRRPIPFYSEILYGILERLGFRV